MRAIAVHLNARLGFILAVCVPADVMTSIDHGHLATGCCGSFSDRKAEETGANNEKVHAYSLSVIGRTRGYRSAALYRESPRAPTQPQESTELD